MSNPTSSLPPGFRFHPTDEELILHYLKNRAASSPCPVSIIAEVDIYKSDPWDLPEKAAFGDREWYFFSPRDRKYPNGNRPNRAAASGYWKATGTDKPIHATNTNEHVGVKKALVFYKGKPPRGVKTDWIMHEYRLAEPRTSNSYKPMKLRDSSMRLDDWVLCRIYKKSSHQPAMEPPAMNPESSTGTDSAYLSALQQNIPQQHTLRFPKPSSISDFLDFFDNLPEDLSGKQPVISNSNDGNDMNHFVPQLSGSGSAASNVEINLLKRQRTGEEENAGSLHSSKRWNDETSFANQFESPQYSMMSQYSLFHQQMLLNSQLGFQ